MAPGKAPTKTAKGVTRFKGVYTTVYKINANVPNMLGQISETLGLAKLNIHDMVNRSRGDLAYTVVDVDSPIPDTVRKQISAIEGVMMARVL